VQPVEDVSSSAVLQGKLVGLSVDWDGDVRLQNFD
jgi:hypothetical protein